MELILIKPEDLAKGSAYRFSGQIINGLRKEKELSVVGFGNAISLACMAVQISSSIANVSVSELSLDYIGSPKLAISGIFFILDKESKINWDEKKVNVESKMKLNFERDGQLVVVSKKLSPDEIMPLCLSKLAKSDLLKITGAGVSISRAVSVALELTKGNIAKEPWGIKLVTLSTVPFKVEETTVFGTGIEIFLEKGSQTCYTEKHKQILKMLEKQ